MTLTPRQIAAFLEFSGKIERIERAVAFKLAAHAAQSDSKTIERTLKDISNGGEV
jgi:hypothetical protein